MNDKVGDNAKDGIISTYRVLGVKKPWQMCMKENNNYKKYMPQDDEYLQKHTLLSNINIQLAPSNFLKTPNIYMIIFITL